MGNLTRDEDAALRRLHWFEQQLGARLGPSHRVVKEDIRARDRRAVVREPEDGVELVEPEDATSARA